MKRTETDISKITLPIQLYSLIGGANPYYFIKNLQGDVIAIVDKDAKTVARYSYDAWGVPKIDSDSSGCSIATINPFRYRSYYYDEEIKLYYLQSRYYDACVSLKMEITEYVIEIFFSILSGT